MTEPNHIAEARKKVSRPQIREIFLRNGARIEPDRDDLPDWIYESAFELLELAAPAVQGEPEAYISHTSEGDILGWERQFDAPSHTLLYPTPQPAEQQPDPTDAQILAITTAYEQGVGKGHDAHHQGEEIRNPYGTSWGCDKAWQMGYEEGKKQAANDAKSSAVKPRPAPDITQLVEALESLIKGYVGLLEAGKDRITSLGGDCDPVPVMEQNDPWLRDARAALATYRKGGDEE